MEVDVKEESCLQTKGHSRVFRVSDWRVLERVSRCEFASAELGLRSALGKRIGGFLRELRRLVSCIGGV